MTSDVLTGSYENSVTWYRCPRCGEPADENRNTGVWLCVAESCHWNSTKPVACCRLCSEERWEDDLCRKHFDRIEMLRMERLL